METPELAPLRPFTPAKAYSPTQQRPHSQRSSSFSSTYSGLSGRRQSTISNRRLSNASRYSNGYDEALSPLEQRNRSVSGMGTLADELASDDDEEWEQGVESGTLEQQEELDEQEQDGTQVADDELGVPPASEGSRDSGIVISKPPKGRGPRRRSHDEQDEEPFTPELEAAINSISSLANSSAHSRADTTTRTLSALRELPSESDLETYIRRLATSLNSTASSLTSHSKALHSILSSVLSPLASLTSPLSTSDVDDLLALHTALLATLPTPDAAAAAKIGKLTKETEDLQSALGGLLDSLQVNKQVSANAARLLKTALGMVGELRREEERAEEGRYWIERDGWGERLEGRWCAAQCRDVCGGFESFAEGVRREIEGAGG